MSSCCCWCLAFAEMATVCSVQDTKQETTPQQKQQRQRPTVPAPPIVATLHKLISQPPWRRSKVPPPFRPARRECIGEQVVVVCVLSVHHKILTLYQPHCPSFMQLISVTCKDVVMGRGSGTQNHCGNITYRKLVYLNKVRVVCSTIIIIGITSYTFLTHIFLPIYLGTLCDIIQI